MKIKVICLMLLVLVLCGCDVTYDLDVDDFTEIIEVIPNNDNDRAYLNYYGLNDPAMTGDYDFPEDGSRLDNVEYYSYNRQGDSLLATYKFGLDNYHLSKAANFCFPSLLVIKEENIRINTLNKFECFSQEPNLDKVTINITVPYEVVYNNADRVNGKIYTWVFEREGTLKSIDLEYKNPDFKEKDKGNSNKKNNGSSKKDKEENENNRENNTLYILLIGGLFFISIFGIIIFTNKKKN